MSDLDDFLELNASRRLLVSTLEYPKIVSYVGLEEDLKVTYNLALSRSSCPESNPSEDLPCLT